MNTAIQLPRPSFGKEHFVNRVDCLAAALTALCAAVGSFATSSMAQDLAFTIVGVVLAGYGAAAIKTDPTLGEAERRTKLSSRWLSNFALGVPLGPALGNYLSNHFDTIERAYVFLISGGISGFSGATIFTMAIPAALRKFRDNKDSRLP